MNFCSACGAKVSERIPEGDNRPRYVCDDCGHIHYQNPRIVTGCLPTWDDRVLLCQRAIKPRAGFWTLPAGFLENGETVDIGASRETAEEANARVTDLELYTVFSLPHISQIYVFFRSRLVDEDFSCGEESLDVALYEEANVPWDQLAFPVITQTLQCFFEDRKTQHFPVRYRTIDLSKHLRKRAE